MIPIKRSKKKLAAPEPLAILDGLDAAVVLLSVGNEIEYLNSSAENLLRVSSSVSVGKDLKSFCATLEGESLENILNDARRAGTVVSRHALPLRVADGGRVVVDLLCNGLSTSRSWVLELRPVEASLRRAEEEMQDKVFEAAQEMLAGLAHEIKNPLGGLRGAAQLLERELPTPELQEYTRIILHEVDRLRRLVDRLRGDKTQPQRRMVNIHEVLEHVRRLLQVNLPTGVALRFDYDLSIPEFEADPEQLVQVFLNLLRNARQALAGQGMILIRTRVERFVNLQQHLYRLVLRVDISDDGPGISEDLLPRIFLPLVTSRAEGMGMGLAIVQNLVRAHGGTVHCRSLPGDTEFSVRLPLSDGRFA
ncbi:nitrogen regulation protein NR(II) [Acidithiobacillus sp. IBUN Pt1247-S3]|uniref:nitrogen regulation protein NR(II) n=1 Tax=Acidithiobacillus sp. IBUN Pt1247-S3 TaxID=3166642 RepID=UPI0034E59224